jgi:ATP-dependent Clp protease protease subunit
MIQGSGDEELIAKILDSSEPDLRSIGLFAELEAEKIAEICHAMLYLNEMNNVAADPSLERPIHFYISTYGGNADDMFALYDLMRIIREETEIHTIGLGKVMSAGVLILAAGTKGKRYIGRNCRVMLHAVMGGNQGSLHDMMNEMDAIEQLQQMYIECLVKETKMTESTIKKMLERKINIYLSAEEAVEHGIADYIV